jgi:hypothetical protein
VRAFRTTWSGDDQEEGFRVLREEQAKHRNREYDLADVRVLAAMGGAPRTRHRYAVIRYVDAQTGGENER